MTKKMIGEWLAEHGSTMGVLPDIEDPDEREQFVLENARKIFDKHGKLLRTLILRSDVPGHRHRKLMLVTLDVPYELADEVPIVIRAMAQSVHAKQLYLVMETWYSRMTQEEHEQAERGIVPKRQPRHDPNRREAITVSSEDAFRVPPIRSWKAEITRDAKGKPTLHEWEDFPMQSGRMVHLLPPEVYIRPGERMPQT